MAQSVEEEREEEEEEDVQMRRPSTSIDDDQSLLTQPWYWPHISRGEAERRLAGQPDGSFLVRDCTVPGDFTLTVRKDGCNRCVRIYRQKKGYSTLPAGSSTLFSTLSELVEFYKSNSLATFNKRLGIHLQTPVSKPTGVPNNQYSVFKELYDLSHEQHASQNKLSILHQQHIQLANKVKTYKLTLPALEVVQGIYYDNIALQADWEAALLTEGEASEDQGGLSVRWVHRERSFMRNSDTTSDPNSDQNEHADLEATEEKRWRENTELLLCRHKAVSCKLEEVRSQLTMCSQALHDLESELQFAELTAVSLKIRYDELVRQMVELGCHKEYVCRVLEWPTESPGFHSSTWLMDCTRKEARMRLALLPHGAFLVRPKNHPQFPYVLSIVVSPDDNLPPTVHHCCIVHPKGRGLGFNAVLAVFHSIEQLVLRHRYLSLKYYFSHLDVSLSFPVGCQQMLQRSCESDRVRCDQLADMCGDSEEELDTESGLAQT